MKNIHRCVGVIVYHLSTSLLMFVNFSNKLLWLGTVEKYQYFLFRPTNLKPSYPRETTIDLNISKTPVVATCVSPGTFVLAMHKRRYNNKNQFNINNTIILNKHYCKRTINSVCVIISIYVEARMYKRFN